jgi:serine/threonine-protein kinase RsbW
MDQRRIAIEILMRSMDSHYEVGDLGRLARALGMPEASLRPVLDGLQMSGMILTGGSIRPLKDNVLQDFIRSVYMREVEGRAPEKVRRFVMERRYKEDSGAYCFEMTIPMASDAELVAARAVEQIGRNINLKPDVINRLQLALIEACINAMEHSGSYERNVLLKFTVRPDKIEISIESPGRAFAPDAAGEPDIEEKLRSRHKRGWGLKLMHEFMDEVKVERIEDRTRVVLIKNISTSEVAN